jgi:protein-S-isoprenylcysteine O-methyltransferase Ste14
VSAKNGILPPTYFLLALVVMTGLHLVWPIHRYWELPISLAGLAPLTLGVFLNVAADQQLKRHQTTVKPFEEPAALITTFPFSATRSPMYLGMTLMLVGVALLFGTVSPLVPAAVFAFLMEFRFIRAEEATLARVFGREWNEYCDRTRRWL